MRAWEICKALQPSIEVLAVAAVVPIVAESHAVEARSSCGFRVINIHWNALSKSNVTLLLYIYFLSVNIVYGICEGSNPIQFSGSEEKPARTISQIVHAG